MDGTTSYAIARVQERHLAHGHSSLSKQLAKIPGRWWQWQWWWWKLSKRVFKHIHKKQTCKITQALEELDWYIRLLQNWDEHRNDYVQ